MKRDRPIAGGFNALALLGVVFGVPIVVVWGIDRPLPWLGRPEGSLWSALSGPGLPSLLLSMALVVLGTAWAVFVLCILKELISRMGGVASPNVPGFQLPQAVSRHMVGNAARLICAPAVHSSPPQPRRSTSAKKQRVLHLLSISQWRNRLHAGKQDTSAPTEVKYRVLPGDSLWSIASTELGQGSRADEIAKLNRSLLGERPGFLTPGLDLMLPPIATTPQPSSLAEREQRLARAQRYHIHSVRAGETLSTIAADWLGATHRYTEILDASRDIVQPGGRRLLDSRVLNVGWKVAIPRTDVPRESSVEDDKPVDDTTSAKTSTSVPQDTAPVLEQPIRESSAMSPAGFANVRTDDREPHLGS